MKPEKQTGKTNQPELTEAPPNGNGKTEVAKRDPRVVSIRGLLERSSIELRKAVPSGVSLKEDRIIRMAMTCIQENPKLLECTPQSILSGVMQATQLGLVLDGIMGEAHLVPRKGVAKFQTGYRGLRKLACRSGEVATIVARAVRVGDEFHYEYGLAGDTLRHIPSSDGKGELIGAYAVARFTDKNVEPMLLVMSASQINDVMKTSISAAGDGFSPWKGPFVSEMWIKTVTRRICKQLPLGDDAAKAIMSEEYEETGAPMPHTVGDLVDKIEPRQSKTDRLADRVGGREPIGTTAEVVGENL